MLENDGQIALRRAMEVPIGRVPRHVERVDQRDARRREDADQQLRAIDARALDARLVVVGRAEPAPRFGDDGGALACFFCRHRRSFPSPLEGEGGTRRAATGG